MATEETKKYSNQAVKAIKKDLKGLHGAVSRVAELADCSYPHDTSRD